MATWLKLAGLFIEAVVLVMQYLRDRETAGIASEAAFKEITDAINDRIAAAVAARAAPHDDSVRDPYDRG